MWSRRSTSPCRHFSPKNWIARRSSRRESHHQRGGSKRSRTSHHWHHDRPREQRGKDGLQPQRLSRHQMFKTHCRWLLTTLSARWPQSPLRTAVKPSVNPHPGSHRRVSQPQNQPKFLGLTLFEDGKPGHNEDGVNGRMQKPEWRTTHSQKKATTCQQLRLYYMWMWETMAWPRYKTYRMLMKAASPMCQRCYGPHATLWTGCWTGRLCKLYSIWYEYSMRSADCLHHLTLRAIGLTVVVMCLVRTSIFLAIVARRIHSSSSHG